MRDSYGNSESMGDPTGASAPRADRPRKASAYVPINVKICTSKKTVDKLDYHRVCLQSEASHSLLRGGLFLSSNPEVYPSHFNPLKQHDHTEYY
ncbi:hypothetical protein FB545_4991 [Peribacillus frigoritolerans]|nr:hypothetical protein FB545_4991 [Peribacillus frigoritolerans]